MKNNKNLRLVIKGMGIFARAEASKRNIKLYGVTCNRIGETLAYTPNTLDNRDKVVRWFCEPKETIPGHGYPIGTLLLY